MTELIKAAEITEENIEIVKVFAETEDLAKASVKIGNWFVCLTIRSETLFNMSNYRLMTQLFYIVTPKTLHEHLTLIGEPSDEIINAYLAERIHTISHQNNDVKEKTMTCGPLTTAYILYMIDHYGSRTHEVLMDYGRESKAILAAFDKARGEGYLRHDNKPRKPYLTEEGRAYLREYYGNDFNGYDE